MADFTCKKHGDFTLRWTLSIDGVAIDVADYTGGFLCKMRDSTNTSAADYYIPGGVITLTVDETAGTTAQIDTSLTDTQTATLTATGSADVSRLPLIDVQLTHGTSLIVSYTDSYTVEIVDTQSYT